MQYIQKLDTFPPILSTVKIDAEDNMSKVCHYAAKKNMLITLNKLVLMKVCFFKFYIHFLKTPPKKTHFHVCAHTWF